VYLSPVILVNKIIELIIHLITTGTNCLVTDELTYKDVVPKTRVINSYNILSV
jgi:hypothetical protein